MKKFSWLFIAVLLFGCGANDDSELGSEAYEEAPRVEEIDNEEKIDDEEEIVMEPELDKPEEELALGNFTVVEGFYASFEADRTNIISIEEVAEIAATEIFERFGETLDGKMMYLTFHYNPHITDFTWGGYVFDEVREVTLEDHSNGLMFQSNAWFVIDALTGEVRDMMWFNWVGDVIDHED